jgi:hypothetical protein
LYVSGAVQDARQVSSESQVACVGSREKPVETQVATPVARAVVTHTHNADVSADNLSLDTEVKYPLLRACSTSAALMAAGKHTHVAHIGRLAILHISNVKFICT